MKSDVLIMPWTSVIGLPHRAQRLPRLPSNFLSIPIVISSLRSHCCRIAALTRGTKLAGAEGACKRGPSGQAPCSGARRRGKALDEVSAAIPRDAVAGNDADLGRRSRTEHLLVGSHLVNTAHFISEPARFHRSTAVQTIGE
jgi:hypothetical protein